jgi:large exoprotein involved in heme utilization and adhesion
MVGDQLTITGTPGVPMFTGIASDAEPGSTGNAGGVTIGAGILSILNGGEISSSTFGLGNAGSISVSVVGGLTIDAATISSQANRGSAGNAGTVRVGAGSLSVVNDGVISSSTSGSGVGGSVSVSAAGQLTIDGTSADTRFLTGITAQADLGQTGNAGDVTVTARSLTILSNGEISTNTLGTGKAGNVSVNIGGLSSIDGTAAARVTGIAARSRAGSTGDAGSVHVDADAITIANNGQIPVRTEGRGNGGDVAITVAGSMTLSQGGRVTAATAGASNGGTVQVTAQGPLSLTDPGTGIAASAEPGSSGNAGSVIASAPQITLGSGAEIASTTAGTGAGGSVTVTTPGALVLNGNGDPIPRSPRRRRGRNPGQAAR